MWCGSRTAKSKNIGTTPSKIQSGKDGNPGELRESGELRK
jgi:hypothetical protein